MYVTGLTEVLAQGVAATNGDASVNTTVVPLGRDRSQHHQRAAVVAAVRG